MSGPIPPGTVVNLEGKIVPPDQALVPVFDRGFLFGDSVYETLRTYDGRLFAVEEHLDRFDASRERIALRLELPRKELVRRMEETLAAAGNPESYLRVIATRGTGEFGLARGLDNPGTLILIVRPYSGPTPEEYQRGVSVIIPRVRRNPREALDPAIKSGNYLNSIQALLEARAAGADDAVMLNMAGKVTEATTASVFAVTGGRLVTPPLTAGILDGITRRYAVAAARAGKIPVEEQDLTAEELEGAEEVFLTSTLREVLPVRRVNRRELGPPGAITRRMRELLSAAIRAAHAREGE